MTFAEVFESMILDSHICETEINKCDIFAESSFREFHINCMESELKVLTESGTEDDYKFLVEAAEESLFERIKKSIKKAVEALREFIRRTVEKIKGTVAADKAKQALTKLKNLVSENPILKKEKIEMNDLTAEFKAIDKGTHKLNAKLTKIKSGKVNERDTEDINEIIEETEKDRKNIADKTTAVSISVDSAIDQFEDLVKEANDGAAIKEANDAASDIEKEIDSGEGKDESVLRNIYKICSAKAALAKSKLSSLVNTIMVLWAKLKNKIFGAKKKVNGEDVSDDKEKDVEESTSFFGSDEYIGETFSEVFGETITEIDDGSYSKIPSMSSPFSEAVMNSDSYSSLFDNMENELFKEAYFGKSETLVEAEKILDALIPIIKSNPLGDYTNHPLSRALANALKRQFGFKDLFLTWKRSSKSRPSIYTFVSSDIAFSGKNIVGIDKKTGYFDKEHAHTAYITLSSTFPAQVNLTGAEYLAFILHEIGHNFDASMYNMIHTLFNIIKSTFLVTKLPDPNNSEVLNTYVGVDLLPMIISTGPGKSIYHTLVKWVEKILDGFPFLKRIADLGRRLGDWFNRVLDVYLSPALLASLPTFVLLSPSAHLAGLFARKGEMFADSFAAAYGYGSELLSGLTKFDTAYKFKATESGSIKDAVSDLNEHPIRRFFTDLSIAESYVISLLTNGTHSTDINRAKLNLDMLKKDLQNGDFPPDVRASLQQEVAKFEKSIEDYRRGYFDGNEETNLPLTLCARQLLYNSFHGRSDYIAKLFPDNFVKQESADEHFSITNNVSENLDDVFESIIADLNEN